MPDELQRLISLTFDSDPKVRLEAAEKLGKIDDPAAVFALLELCYDKNEKVKAKAREILESKKGKGPKFISFSEIFSSSDDKEEKDKEEILTKKKKLLQPIEKIFDKKLGKRKAKVIKKKMMPTIEKLYLKALGKKEKDQKAIQEFLTSYLDVISDIDKLEAQNVESERKVHTDNQEHEEKKKKIEEVEEKEQSSENRLSLDDSPPEITDIPEVGTEVDVQKVFNELKDIDEIEEAREQRYLETLPDTFFKRAYEVMMLSEGDENIMKAEKKRLLAEVEKDINLAFKIAKEKFKSVKITRLAELRDKMKNINTDILLVKKVENFPYVDRKKKGMATRIVVEDDEGTEGIIYLFDNRGLWLKPEMKIKVFKGYVKTFKFSGETAITIGKKGSIHIVL